MQANLLIIDDEEGVLEALATAFERDFRVQVASSSEAALAVLERKTVDVVLCDISLPGMNGEQFLSAVKVQWPGMEVIMLTAVKDISQAVRCMRLGAYDYVSKPWDLVQLKDVVGRAAEKVRLVRENEMLRQSQNAVAQEQLLGDSAPMAQLRDLLKRVAAHDSVVLIQGESGTGKELVARSIHALSARRRERFVAIGCGSIPADLVESELFGHEKGAFSSAYSARVGKFEYASGGTLFLDDVAALPQAMQAKLLRVLQEREICRLGSNRTIPVDVRVLSSTNVDLWELVQKGQFRDDLYWRLSGVPVKVPPLRERGSDKELLFRHFVGRVAERSQRPVPAVSQGVLDAIERHDFPGNVRELMHLAETLFVLSDEDGIGVTALPVDILLQGRNGGFQQLPLKRAVREFERQVIQRTLRQFGGNQSRCAEHLGIHRNTLLMKMSEFGLGNKKA